jgi:hypothetical protein
LIDFSYLRQIHSALIPSLDDWPPFLGIRFLQGAQSFGRLLLARENFVSEIGKFGTHYRIGQCRHSRRIELADDLPWRGFGRAEPGVEGKRWQSHLAKGGMSGATAKRVSLVTTLWPST